MEKSPAAIAVETKVNASIVDAWRAWTTVDGVKSFFAPGCFIELHSGGAYEMYFDLNAEKGKRGSEGCVILALEEPRMFSFTWNAPPEFPAIRGEKTHVTLYFSPLGAEKTHVMLVHDGWGTGEEWQAVRSYFERAWEEIVLPRLQRRFSEGPIRWNEQK